MPTARDSAGRDSPRPVQIFGCSIHAAISAPKRRKPPSGSSDSGDRRDAPGSVLHVDRSAPRGSAAAAPTAWRTPARSGAGTGCGSRCSICTALSGPETTPGHERHPIMHLVNSQKSAGCQQRRSAARFEPVLLGEFEGPRPNDAALLVFGSGGPVRGPGAPRSSAASLNSGDLSGALGRFPQASTRSAGCEFRPRQDRPPA